MTDTKWKVPAEAKYLVYAGSEKMDLGPKGEPQCYCRSQQQAEHMAKFWAPAGYWEEAK